MQLYVIIIAFSLIQMGLAEKSNNTTSTFKPTEEWQEIGEGQGIPAGLHVRINLQTGKKEAKLLNESANNENASAALSLPPENISESPPPPAKGTTKHNLKLSRPLTDALKSLPREEVAALEYTPEKIEKIKRNYKTYKELKESYEDIRKSFKTDAEVIKQLIEDYRGLSKAEANSNKNKDINQLRIVENLIYLVHQIDNAAVFIDEGGLDHVVLPLIVNQTDLSLRVRAMRVLGALTQNNPAAQIKVFERNFGAHLSQILTTSTHTEELSSALYAFGSLLRKFPHAQQRIFSTSGTQALMAVLAKECELKIKAKAITLVSDVIVEQRFVLTNSKANTNDDAGSSVPLAVAQYAELHFSKWLQANSYCETVDTTIANALYELLDQPDMAEYFVHALHNTHDFCRPLWAQSPQLRHALLTVMNRYEQSGEEYRLEVAHQLREVIVALYPDNGKHDEL